MDNTMVAINIRKRDGRLESIDITKIQNHIKRATKELENVSEQELEEDSKISFYDGMHTKDIQQSLIITALGKIDVDKPQWTYVAARLLLSNLYHNINPKTKGYPHLKEYFENAESKGKIIKGFKNRFDLELLNTHIDPSRDYQFTYLGIKTLYDRYLLKDSNNNPIELPQHMFMAIAMFLAQNEDEKDRDEWAIKFYNLLSKFEVMCATPILSNARTPHHQLASCFIGSTPDNIEGIFESYKEMAILSKYGGGLGWDFSQIRGLNSCIDNNIGAAGGVIPFLKITNDIATAVDQLGTRKGAITVYLEIWHVDIEEFISLRGNSGDERRKTHDLFLGLWISDLFMERMLGNKMWSLFDPYFCPDLTELYGDDFIRKYEEYESDSSMVKSQIPARELWKKILISYYETGTPFLCFKDTANKANPNKHNGIIRSSNLCTEIFQNTSPNSSRVQIEYTDGRIDRFRESELITTDTNETKKANKVTNLDSINSRSIYSVSKVMSSGNVAVCNLASINLSKVHTKEELERVIPLAVRMLDNAIDLNYYPVRSAKATNESNRAIGLGVMGEAEMLATQSIYFGSKEHLHKIDEIMEVISFNTIKSSAILAKQRGSYPLFQGSNWSRGVFPIDVANRNAKDLINREHIYDWSELRDFVKDNGVRNGYLMAIAPTSSISILVSTTQSVEPVFALMWNEENLSGLIRTTAPNLTLSTMPYYKSAFDTNQLDVIKAAAIRQKWIDQGQSLNIFIRNAQSTQLDGKKLSDIYTSAWKFGVKSTYYLRSESPEYPDRSIECFGCQ